MHRQSAVKTCLCTEQKQTAQMILSDRRACLVVIIVAMLSNAIILYLLLFLNNKNDINQEKQQPSSYSHQNHQSSELITTLPLFNVEPFDRYTYNVSSQQEQLKKKIVDILTTTQNQSIKIGIGCGKDVEVPGFPVCSDAHNFNLTSSNAWEYLFGDMQLSTGDATKIPYPPVVLFAEHVFEHMTIVETIRIAYFMKKYLPDGSVLRVAVPDGFHPSKDYQLYVKAGGTPSGYGHNHMIVWNHIILGELFTSLGLRVRLLEYFDISGKFHFEEWDDTYGRVIRSKRYDKRNTPENPLKMTSLIMDVTV